MRCKLVYRYPELSPTMRTIIAIKKKICTRHAHACATKRQMATGRDLSGGFILAVDHMTGHARAREHGGLVNRGVHEGVVLRKCHRCVNAW